MIHLFGSRLGATLFAFLAIAATACATVVGEPIGQGASQSAEGDSGGGGTGGGPPVTPIMNEKDAQTWCDWYVFTAYPNADINLPPSPQAEHDGLITGYEALYCYKEPWPGGACLTRPTVADCVRNILHASCQASVADLDACVAGMIDGNEAGTGCPLSGACDAFAAAGCAHTVVSEFETSTGGGGPGCALHVE
jgi:hypothetical protein